MMEFLPWILVTVVSIVLFFASLRTARHAVNHADACLELVDKAQGQAIALLVEKTERLTSREGHRVDHLEKLIRDAVTHTVYEHCPHPDACACPPQERLEEEGERLRAREPIE